MESRSLKDQPGIREPGDRGAATGVKDSPAVTVDQIQRTAGQQGGISRRCHMILDYSNWLLGLGQPEHQLDEIAPGGFQTTRSENSRCPDDERSLEIGLRIKLASQLGNRVRPQGMRRIFLGIRAPGGAVEHVIRGEVHEPAVRLSARQRQIAHAQGIREKSSVWFPLGDINLVIRSRVEYDVRIEFS